MFVRKNKNRSGSVSVQIVRKVRGKTSIIKTVGVSKDPRKIALLVSQAKTILPQIIGQPTLLPLSSVDSVIKNFLGGITNLQVQVIGPELIFGSLFDRIGFNLVDDELFRHLVIARLAYPTSKLGTVDYLYRYQGIHIQVDEIYRFLDDLANKHQVLVEKIVFEHTRRLLDGDINVVFYDLTTLYF